MRRCFLRAAIVTCAVLLILGPQPVAAGQPQDGRGGRGQGRGFGVPPRDGAAGQPLAAGTAVVSGTVMVSGTGQPARRARVTLNALEAGGGARTATTDENGRYAFLGLPAGRYTLAASKQGHVSVLYGQTLPGRPGTPIELGEGQKFSATLQLPRGGVLTGMVIDEYGEPAPGTQVRAMRYVFQGGRRAPQQAGTGGTDDRGIYRIFGLQPGEYIVSAVPRNAGAALEASAIEGELRAVRERLASGNLDPSIAKQIRARAASLQMQLPREQDEQPSGYAPIYYPGTTTASEAAVVPLGVGEERTNVDFQLHRVPMARLQGIVVNTTGAAVQNVMLTLVHASDSLPGIGASVTRADGQGRFTMHNVAPGRYRLVARANVSTGERGAPPPGRGRGAVLSSNALRLWGSADVAVDGRRQDDIVIPLQAGMAVSGRVVFEGTLAPPADPTRVRVTLTPAEAPGPGTLAQPASVSVDATGRFTIPSVVPGLYRLTAGGAGSGWRLASATVDGQEALDFPFEVRPGQAVTGATITFTDRRTQLTGAITDPRGQPAPAFTLILFAADPQYWTPQSRRVRSTRPSTSGQFTFSDVPPGEYKLVAIVDVEPGAWSDPRFLEQIDAASMRIALRDGEQKTQHLQVQNP